MDSFTTPAIMLRKIDHGDDDLIINFLALDKGKVSVIAKSAKKSIKRFSGILELFSVLEIVWKESRRKGLPVLQEAAVQELFPNIRGDIKKTAYASYWTELIYQWIEEGNPQNHLFYLLQNVFEILDKGEMSGEVLSILFQMRFLTIAGLSPNLKYCGTCRTETEKMKENKVIFDIAMGSLLCEKCNANSMRRISLSKGTVKQLLWINDSDFKKALRVRFTPLALKEGLNFLETFMPYHLGKVPKSLGFLRKIRD